MKKWRWLVAGVIVGALVWSANNFVAHRRGEAQVRAALPDNSRSVLDTSEKFVLFALYPHTKDEEPEKWKSLFSSGKKDFHGFLVIGQTIVTDSAEKRNLLSALYGSMAGANSYAMAACYAPRHGIRATLRNETVDMVICFECHQYAVYKNGKNWRDHFPITKSAQGIFNESLQRAGIINPY